MMRIAFYGTKPYDKTWFEPLGKEYGFDIHFLELPCNEDTIFLANGHDAICIFVNDYVNAAMIEKLYDMKVKAILLRSAGFNNVDVKAAELRFRSKRTMEADHIRLFYKFLYRYIFHTQLFIRIRIITFPNVLVTSHMGFFTQEAMQAIAIETLENAHALENGLPLVNRVASFKNIRCSTGSEIKSKKLRTPSFV